MKHRRRVKIGVVVGAIIAIALFILFMHMKLNAPHEGVVVVEKPKSSVAGFDMTPKTAAGTYISFKYPAGMDVTPNNPLVDPVVEQFNFMHRDIESWNLAIAVMKNPGGSISTNNSYQYRKTKPDVYKESVETVNGKKYTVMTDVTAGGFSKAAIMQHGGMGATVSLVGDDPAGTENLQKTFDMILASWQWR